ncbi:hypothetical protein [Amycolatopsis sacchari]|uniref:hypothetical protein n=1 Tax=Amycolatopsis sacchari TaxID=115433 RepID=UPI003D741110
MTVAPEPTPTPRTRNPAPQQAQRPDLRLVPPPTIPPENANEITGPIPVVDAAPAAPAALGVDRPGATQPDTVPEPAGRAEHGLPAVTPQAPLDVRLLEALGELLQARPRWKERPPSPAEAFEYSTSGDWTAEEKSLKRIAHGLCVLLAFGVTYPIDWVVQAARQKPIGFVLCIAVLFVLTKVL